MADETIENVDATEVIKIGREISARNAERIQAAHDALTELGAACRVEPEVTEIPFPKSLEANETVVAYGTEVKALPDNKVGGYLIRFSSENDPDLTGDYFTKDTDFGKHNSTPVLYQHGLDVKLGGRVIGEGTLKQDDVGIWLEAQLSARDEYEKYIYQLAQDGKLGWSSGTASHLVERTPKSKAAHITRWPLGLDASLTPTPAEPRNTVIPLKALFPAPSEQPETQNPTEPEAGQHPAESDGEAAAATKSTPIKEKTEMDITPEKLQEMLDAAAQKGSEAVIKSLPTNGNGNVAVVEDEADRAAKGNPFKDLGEQLIAIKKAAYEPANTDKRLYAIKELAIKQTGANEGIGSDGGFLVQQDFASEIVSNAYNEGTLISRIRKLTVGPNSNGTAINLNAEGSRVTGSRWGGVQLYWLNEAGTKLPSQPHLRRAALNLKKLIGLFWATDELLQDATALGSWAEQAFTEEFEWMLDDAIINGALGGPLGFMASPALVTQAAEPLQGADTIVTENIVKMYSRLLAKGRSNAIWIYNQDVEPQLFTMTLGTVPVFMPPGGVSDAPYGRILGRPAIAMEQCATIGNLGDICFINPKGIVSIDKGGLQRASSIHVHFTLDETCFRWVYRFDAQPMLAAPLTPATGVAASTLSDFVALAAR